MKHTLVLIPHCARLITPGGAAASALVTEGPMLINLRYIEHARPRAAGVVHNEYKTLISIRDGKAVGPVILTKLEFEQVLMLIGGPNDSAP